MIENNIIIRDAVIINRNFEGRAEKPYNPEGKRNFSVVLDEETANVLLKDGWNVKIRQSKTDPDEPPKGYLSVSVNFNSSLAPLIMQITRKNGRIKKTPMKEEYVSLIDTAEIKNVKLEIRPYNWSLPSGQSGVRAYLKTMYYELVEDVFASEYDEYGDDLDLADQLPLDME